MIAEQLFGDVSSTYEILGRLLFAVGAGALVGIEREYHGRPAGLRTHILVSLGAAVVAVISTQIPEVSLGEQTSFRADPGRIAAGVVTGIGFLGAGAIIRMGITARGLTTAASLWCMASIGMGFGFGLYRLSGFAVALVLFTLFVLGAMERRITRHWYKSVNVTLPGSDAYVSELRKRFKEHAWHIIDLKIRKQKSEDVMHLEVDLRLNSKQEVAQLVHVLDETDFVRDYTVS